MLRMDKGYVIRHKVMVEEKSIRSGSLLEHHEPHSAPFLNATSRYIRSTKNSSMSISSRCKTVSFPLTIHIEERKGYNGMARRQGKGP
jgi:hypothetical protein